MKSINEWRERSHFNKFMTEESQQDWMRQTKTTMTGIGFEGLMELVDGMRQMKKSELTFILKRIYDAIPALGEDEKAIKMNKMVEYLKRGMNRPEMLSPGKEPELPSMAGDLKRFRFKNGRLIMKDFNEWRVEQDFEMEMLKENLIQSANTDEIVKEILNEIESAQQWMGDTRSETGTVGTAAIQKNCRNFKEDW